MRKLFFLNLFLLAFLVNVYPQKDNPKFYPPSPEAYALGKYGDVPVSLYTGIPDISIPLYKLTEKELSVSVTLSYHASGIKIDETSSNVGLGWVMNSGGLITRSVRGKAEYLVNGVLKPDRSNIPECTNCTNNTAVSTFINNNGLAMSVDGGLDPEPDVFYYNFNGRSGKFYFDKNGVAQLNKDEAIAISWRAGSNPQEEIFTIKDELGFKYEFSDHEKTFYGTNEGAKVSAWYLSKITSPAGNSVLFTYEGNSFNETIRSYADGLVEVVNGSAGNINPPLNYTNTNTNVSGIRLKKITGTWEAIDFIYAATARLDLPGVPRLQKISVKNAQTNQEIKYFNLYAGYFEANNVRKYDGAQPESNKHLNYRLRLDSLEERSALDASIGGVYKFYYLGDNDPATDDPYTLPYRLSPSQDFWGYYNFTKNTHLLPGIQGQISQNTLYTSFFPDASEESLGGSAFFTLGGGADRSANAVAAKAGMLSRIVYPTGGRSEFTFELNDQSVFQGGLRIKKIRNFSSDNIPNEINYKYFSSPSSQQLDPMKYSFQYFNVAWDGAYHRPIPGESVLSTFGLPTPASATKFVRISAQPTAILGSLNDVGHSVVEVSRTGNGKTINSFISSSLYSDYATRDLFNEGTAQENSLVGSLYLSEILDPTPSNDYGYVSKYVSYGEFPYPELYQNEWKRGVLLETKTYDQLDSLIQTENFDYYRTLKAVIPGYKVIRVGTPSSNAYLYTKYLLPHAWSQLKSKTTTIYYKNGLNPLITESKYYYDNAEHLQVTRIETMNSRGEKQTSYTSYPMDFASGTDFIDLMKTNHLWAYPVENVTYLTKASSSYISSGLIKEYTPNTTGLVAKEFRLETARNIPLSNFKFSNRAAGVLPTTGSPLTYQKNAQYKLSYLYSRYDSRGNIIEAQKAGDQRQTLLWGYKGQFLVAGIAGKDFTTVSSVIDTSILNKGGSNEAAMLTELGKLRTDSRTKDGVVTSFTYDPVFGLISRQDGAGRTTYYEYDGLGRLSVSKDNEKKVIKKNAYQYADRALAGAGKYFFNEEQKKTFYKKDCLEQGTAGPTDYVVPAGTYFSGISVEDANQIAWDDINTNGQQYANENGYCTYINDAMSREFNKTDCLYGTGTWVRYGVGAGWHMSTISKADANRKAERDLYFNGPVYANMHGQCQGTGPAQIELANVFPSYMEHYPEQIKVEFLKNGLVEQTAYYPQSRESSTTISLTHAGTYQLRFTMPDWPWFQTNFWVYYNFFYGVDLRNVWSNNGKGIILTTGEVTFEQGLNYSIKASNSTF
ncbi:hypothetical protein A8C56_10055 [Niabella ginsenosidivorans]|uniref:DUF5977 domain-containing protein n=1 Tax=Niabella ginsenosidivorans TaxID=1176587 RepID=A0A1A9I187_9BACT|nr:DUF5977 domain-containing protein [Niabella ginsenosidivorans]ANH81283.1 hypothetical protein A8C56_10055 [Niabella ginsenosidivorans]